jgi:serine/threonine protein kinase
MSELIGTRLGQYQIKEQIAKGGMATVYLARQASMNRDVAIKVLPSNFLHDDTFLERFYLEVEVIAQLQHPHILPVYDFGEYEGLPYIVMAYLSGGTLGDKMAHGLTLHEVGRIVQQIADALDFAHSKGIIHRDFKPGNVLLDEQGNAYLADFGLAKIAESDKNLTGMGVIGTPAYMAPEQAQPGNPSKSVDIYALGITIYQMLTGSVPYDAPSLAAVLVAHIMEPIPDIREIRPDLPDAIQNVIEKSLAKEVANRYSLAGDLARELLAALQDDPSLLKASQETVQPSLLMTNMLGHVIFVDNQCLNLLKRHHNEARFIMGKPIQEVLGIDAKTAKQVLEAISSKGQLDNLQLAITDARGNPQAVLFSALATRDDDGTFVGADISLQPLPKESDAPASEQFVTVQQMMNTQEKTYLQDYFITQMEALYALMMNWAGKKVAQYLEDIINETGRRNVWAVNMEKGQVTVELKQTDIEAYQALMARGMVYAASVIGKKQVIKEIEYVNKNTSANVLNFVRTLGLDKLYTDLLD